MSDLARISDLLADHRRAKREIAIIRSELIEIAVEELGIPQTEAIKTDLYVLFDGYLIANGIKQEYREGL